jgi:hypothetical protein
VVCIFARQTTEPLTSLVKAVDAQIEQHSALKSFVVVLTDDADKTADTLTKMAKDCRLKHVPLTLVESPSGPPAYHIAQDADVTVMMWKGTEVKVNHAYAKGKLTEAEVKTIVSEIPQLLNE